MPTRRCVARAAGGNITSNVGADLSAVQTVQTQYGLTFEQLIGLTEATLAAIEAEAAFLSGAAQPDFAGMMDGMMVVTDVHPWGLGLSLVATVS